MHGDGTALQAPAARPTSRPEPKSKLGFTAGEVAAILDKHVNTVRAWLKGDPPRLRSTRIGGIRYIPRRALYELLDELELVP